MTQHWMRTERLDCSGTGIPVSAEDGPGKSAVVAGVAARINALDLHADASFADRALVLEAVKTVAAQIDARDCAGAATGYARCLLHEDPAGWSLAAIALRPEQSTPAHDHGGWGGAVTIRGVERDRRFIGGHGVGLHLVDERDYPAGTGYLFDPRDVHQPVGADPSGVTVALHFLVHPTDGGSQHVHEHAARRAAGPPMA